MRVVSNIEQEKNMTRRGIMYKKNSKNMVNQKKEEHIHIKWSN
jgi:hypothetical protein